MNRDSSIDNELLSEFIKNKAIGPGNYSLLHAGGKETHYVDIDTLLGDRGSQRVLLNQLEESILEFIEAFPSGIDRIAFIDKDYGPIGLLPYTTELSNRLNTPPLVVELKREYRLDYLGVKGIHVGEEKPLSNSSIILVDDVVTTGRTQRKAISLIEQWGGEVNAVITAYNRNKDDDALNDMKQDSDLNVRFTDSVLSRRECLEMGILLGDGLEEYIDKDTLESPLNELAISDEDKHWIHTEAEEEVNNIIRQAIDDFLSHNEYDMSFEERERILERAVSSFDTETKEALENLYIDSTIFMNRYGLQAGEEIVSKPPK